MSPSLVELLNEAAVFPAVQDGSVSILRASDLRCDTGSPPLGAGTFATCVSAVKGETVRCVVKIPRFLDYDQFDREMTAMLRCNRHQESRVVRLWWICLPPDGTVGLPRLVMPRICGVMLGTWLSSGRIGEIRRVSVRIVSQLMEAVCHLHEMVGIVHGDLSMKNVMIDATRDHHLTLIDLGNARGVATGQRRHWVHGHYVFSPPEALCEWPCDRILAETHVVGVLVICIERVKTSGLVECPLPFNDEKDREDVCAIARLVQFWGRSRLFPYWNTFRQKVGERIEAIANRGITTTPTIIVRPVGRAGLRLADPMASSRQSLAETLRHFPRR